MNFMGLSGLCVISANHVHANMLRENLQLGFGIKGAVMKIWVSKYALTDGITEHDCIVEGDHAYITKFQYVNGEGKNWHTTKEEAFERADVMRKERIASLRKQIARLEEMRFD